MRFLTVVTITGADDSVKPEEFLEATKKCPFPVEWGILISSGSNGSLRYPSLDWIVELAAVGRENGLRLSAHICGKFVRNIMREGDWSPLLEMGVLDAFQRIQLNFHREFHKTGYTAFVQGLRDAELAEKRIIFQMDGVNERHFEMLLSTMPEQDISPIYDISGGDGVLPDRWPVAVGYAGYAGGLSPENVAEQLPLIAAAAEDRAWIDVETQVRTEDNKWSWDRVNAFLEAVEPWTLLSSEVI